MESKNVRRKKRAYSKKNVSNTDKPLSKEEQDIIKIMKGSNTLFSSLFIIFTIAF